MKQAIEEGFILDVLQNYMTYSTYYKLNKEIEEDPNCKTSDAKRQIARFIELHETNIAQRIEIIVEHYRNNVMNELEGKAKAMVITPSREAAVKYYKAFKDYIAKMNYADIQPLVAFSGKVSIDDEEYTYNLKDSSIVLDKYLIYTNSMNINDYKKILKSALMVFLKKNYLTNLIKITIKFYWLQINIKQDLINQNYVQCMFLKN